jgi:hypothetical protein
MRFFQPAQPTPAKQVGISGISELRIIKTGGIRDDIRIYPIDGHG